MKQEIQRVWFARFRGMGEPLKRDLHRWLDVDVGLDIAFAASPRHRTGLVAGMGAVMVPQVSRICARMEWRALMVHLAR